MKIIFEPATQQKYRTVTIEVPYDDLDIFSLWEDLIRPAILAKGFSETTVNDLIRGLYEQLVYDEQEETEGIDKRNL